MKAMILFLAVAVAILIFVAVYALVAPATGLVMATLLAAPLAWLGGGLTYNAMTSATTREEWNSSYKALIAE